MRLALTMTALALVCAATPASTAPILAPHRAVYDLVLDRATDRSGIRRLEGRMVYEFNGSACDGYTTNYRFVTQIDTADASRLTDQQTSTFEEGDGKMFSFVTKSFVDQSLDKEVKGTATLDPEGVQVDIEKPEPGEVSLGASQFPTQHLIELINKAEDGETFYATSLFDGSEDGDKVVTTTVIVGKPAAIPDSDPEKSVLSTLSGERVWPVQIAYFDDSQPGEELPEYRISFKLHENGVTRDLNMDYGDFSMKGKLVGLTLLPAADCKP
jgi:hypothetical protein